MTEERWQQHYDFPKPGPYEPLIMQCRTNRRAAWAVQLAQDAGLQNCFVYKQASPWSPLLLPCKTCRRCRKPSSGAMPSHRAATEQLGRASARAMPRTCVFLRFTLTGRGIPGCAWDSYAADDRVVADRSSLWLSRVCTAGGWTRG